VNTVFLDTVGLIALWDRNDQWHVAARACFAGLDTNFIRFVTTTFVLLECANHASRKPYRIEVVRMRDDLGITGDLYEPLPQEVDAAWEVYAGGHSGSAGVVDLVSFAVMNRLGIKEAFTNDKHFSAAGFDVLF